VLFAAWNSFKQIIDLPYMSFYLGDPIRDKSHMLWDDRSFVDSSVQVNVKLHNRLTILSIHQAIERFAF
jgi:hypothetical protein